MKTKNSLIPSDRICLTLIIISNEINIYIYQEWHPCKRHHKKTRKVARVGTSSKSAQQGSWPSDPVSVPAEGGNAFRDAFGDVENYLFLIIQVYYLLLLLEMRLKIMIDILFTLQTMNFRISYL
jgi:hypothetical protein